MKLFLDIVKETGKNCLLFSLGFFAFLCDKCGRMSYVVN